MALPRQIHRKPQPLEATRTQHHGIRKKELGWLSIRGSGGARALTGAGSIPRRVALGRRAFFAINGSTADLLQAIEQHFEPAPAANTGYRQRQRGCATAIGRTGRVHWENNDK